jgi:hypothetical protein
MARTGPKIKETFDKLKSRVKKVFICRHKSCGKKFNKYKDWAYDNIEHTCSNCISHNFGSVGGFLILRNLKEKWLRKIKLVAKTKSFFR